MSCRYQLVTQWMLSTQPSPASFNFQFCKSFSVRLFCQSHVEVYITIIAVTWLIFSKILKLISAVWTHSLTHKNYFYWDIYSNINMDNTLEKKLYQCQFCPKIYASRWVQYNIIVLFEHNFDEFCIPHTDKCEQKSRFNLSVEMLLPSKLCHTCWYLVVDPLYRSVWVMSFI